MSDTTPPNPPQPPNNDGSELPPRLLAKLKVEIEGYDLLKRLGQGGQATVYKAIQRQDGRTVAVKVLHAGPHATEEARARLKREINALRAINHPNIVQAIGAGRTRSGLDCLVMNYIDGRPLDHLWSDPAFAALVAPQAADLLRLYKSICETVQAAHRKGITHRDLSPSNILIDANGQPHILDFGMASTAFDGIVTRDVTLTGQFIGKLKYASPEQARGARTPGAAGEASGAGVDIRSDVYALGVMLYQILTGGAFPYQVVGNVIDVLHNIIHSKPRPPSQTVAELHTPTSAMAAPAPASDPRGSASPAASGPVRRNPPLVNETIEAIVLKALEKDPAQRYQSAGELAADIDRYLAGQPTSAVVWSTRPQTQARFRPFRRSVAVAASIVTVVALVGVLMNTKSVALWLGLATAAAPVLPTDLAPLAVSTAEAAALAAQQPDGSDRKLADLAADLAKLDARLRAVHVQLKATTSRKPPELDDRQPGGSGPFPADEFLAALAKSATDTGRPLAFEPLPKADRDRAEQTETSAVERETDQVTLLARRATIDAEQATTWARLAWGTFTGREPDRLFRFQLKKNPTADANMTAKARVLEAGVKVRRLAAKAMEQAVTSLRTLDGAADDGPEGVSLGTVAASLAAQMGPELANFQKAAGTARDGGALTAEEATAVTDLQKQAGRLRDVLEGTAEMHGRAARAADELARFTARDRLQRDLRDTADAAARLDAGLVKLSGEWKFEIDSAASLKDATPAVARRTEPKERNKESQQIDRLDVGDALSGTWTDERGDYQATASVTSVDGDKVTIKITPSFAPEGYSIVVVLNGEQASIVSFVSHIPRPSAFKPQNMRGTFRNGVLDVGGPAEKTDNKGVRTVSEWRFKLKMSRQAAAFFPTQSAKLEGFNRTATDNDPFTATVLESAATRLKLQTRNKTGAIWEWTFERSGDNLTLVDGGFNKIQPNAQFQSDKGYAGRRGVFKEVTATGTVQPDRITFRFTWPQPGSVYEGTIDLTPTR